MSYEDMSSSEKMASMRTRLAFQRTRIAADRTLMAVMRTSFSMIGFGFTIYNFFRSFASRENSLGLIPQEAPAVFGFALVVLGTILLIIGVIYDHKYMQQLRDQRTELIEQGLIGADGWQNRSIILLFAFALVALGLIAVLSILMRSHPFG